MAKRKKPSGAKQDGPYLATAVLCEKVIQEEDKVFTIVRIIDQVTFQLPEGILSKAAFNLGAGLFQASAFIMFKSGSARGKRTLTVRALSPDGSKLLDDLKTPVVFDGKGVTSTAAKIQMGLQFRMEGIHWFHVFLEDKPITRIPLKVILQQQTTSGSSKLVDIKNSTGK